MVEIVSRHLNIPGADFGLGEIEEWMHGSFNACVPIHIADSRRKSNLPRRVIIRFALPYKIGEAFRLGNVEEKLRCEAATYFGYRAIALSFLFLDFWALASLELNQCLINPALTKHAPY